MSLLTPGAAKVGVGNIFYVTVMSPEGKIESRPFIAVAAFDYNSVLEEVRKEGIVKSEDVSARFCELILEREYVWKAETRVLDVGERGRASRALMEVGRYQHNTTHELLRALVRELEGLYMSVEGCGGDLHLLKVENGDTLAQVRIFLDDGAALAEQLTLDLVGPMDYPLPDDIDEILTTGVTQYLMDQYPKLDIGITVRVRKSDLVIAREAVHAPLRKKPIGRYRRTPKH